MVQLTPARAWRDLRGLVVASHRAFFDPQYFFLCAGVVLLLEVAVVAVIIWLVPCRFIKRANDVIRNQL